MKKRASQKFAEYSKKRAKEYLEMCEEILYNRKWEVEISGGSGLSKFTKVGIPWVVMYTEEYALLYEARTRELQIKRVKSRKYIADLIQKGRASRF